MARYWVGGTGTWDATTTTNWALTSGAIGGASVPTNTDDVFFDGNSGTGTVTISGANTIKTLTLTGYAGTLTGNLVTNGSVVLASTATVTGLTLAMNITASTAATLTSVGRTFTQLTFGMGNSASVTLTDALSLSGILTLNTGAFDTGSFAVTASVWNSTGTGTRTLSLGSSSITLTSASSSVINWSVATGFTMTAHTSTITIAGASANLGINNGTVAFNNVVFSGVGPGAGMTANGSSFVNLTVTGSATRTATFLLTPGGTTGNFSVSGTFTVNGNSATNRILVSSSVIGTQRTITAAAVSLSNVDFMDIALSNSGTPTWTVGGAGANVLTANQSSAETDLTGFAANTGLVRSTADARSGAASLLYTAPASGSAQGLSTNNVPVQAGATYTFLGSGKAGPTVTSVAPVAGMKIRWKDSGGTQVGGSVSANPTTMTSAWADLTALTVTAPVGAAFVALEVLWQSIVNTGDQFYADQLAVITLNSGTSTGDAGGNSGITFTASQTNYWVGGTGNWSDVTHWASTSGGAGSSGRVPLPQDDVVINAASGAPSPVSLDMPRAGRNIDLSALIGTFGVSNNPSVFGSVTFGSGVATSFSTGWTLAGRGSFTLTSAGKTVASTNVNAPGGTYTLQDALICTGSLGVTLTAGTLVTNNMAVTTTLFSSTGTITRALTLGTSTVSLTQTTGVTVWSVVSTGLTLSAASSTIVISTASTSTRNVNFGGLTFGTFSYTVAGSTGGLSVDGNASTIGTFNFSDATNARTLVFRNNNQFTINAWNVFGTVGKVVALSSTTAGSAATLTKTSGYLASDYVSVQDITGTGGATFYMGSRSTNVSGNTGLTFTDAPQRYWVGGTDTWDATVGTKWAVVSGGTGGLAVPTTSDDVYLDANSGAGTVTASGSTTSLANNLTCTGFTGTLTGTVQTRGSILLSSGGTYTGFGFQATNTGAVTMTSVGKTIAGGTVNGTSSFTLADALVATGGLALTTGTFQTNNFAITLGSFSSSNTNTRTLTLGSSSVTMTGATSTWNCSTSTGLTITANTSTLTISGSNSSFNGGGLNWNGLSLVFTNSGSVMASGSLVTLASLTKTGTAIKTDAITLAGPVTMTGTFTVTGNSSVNRVLVSSLTVGTSRTITAAAVSVANADFMDIVGAGTGNWDLSKSDTTTPTWTLGGTGGNGLTANQSSVETDTSGWGANNGNTTVARSTAASLNGSASLLASAVAGGIVQATTAVAGGYTPCVGGATYTALASVMSANVARTARVDVSFFTGNGSGFISVLNGAVVSTTTSGWTGLATTATAPANATYMAINVTVPSASAGEGFYVDSTALFQVVPGGAGDALGNSGITFTPATTRYAVAAGNWSSTATWSATSGGSAGATVPLSQDTVVLNASSAAGTYFLDMPRAGKDINCTGFTRTLTWSTTSSVFGSLTFSAAMTLTWAGAPIFSGRGTHTITSAGQVVTQAIAVTAPGGTYSLQDAWAQNNNINIAFSVTDGTFNSNNFSMATWGLSAASGRTAAVNLGTSTVTIYSTAGGGNVLNWSNAATTISAASATIVLAGVSTAGGNRIFLGPPGGRSVGTITYTVASSSQGVQFVGPWTIGTLNVGSGRPVVLPSSTTTIVNNWNVAGSVTATDTFTRADSATTLGSSETGSLPWTAHLGTWGISTNRAYVATDSAGAENLATVDASASDVDVSVTYAVAAASTALVFRLSDTSNFWMVDAATGVYNLRKKVAGTFTIAGSSTGAPVDGDVIRVVARGSSITVFKNGVSVITTSDSQNSSATRHGMRNGLGSSTSRLDNFSVAALTTVSSSTPGTQAVLLSIGTQISSSYLSVTDVAAGAVRSWMLGGTGGNLLTANQSSVETDTSGWISNGTIARTTAQSLDGAASLQLTSTGAAQTVESWATLSPAVAGKLYVAFASSRASGTPRNIRSTLNWSSAYPAVTFLSSTPGPTTLNTTTGWTQHIAAAVAPTSTVGAYLAVGASDSISGDVMYVDKAVVSATTPAYAGTTSTDGGNNTGWLFSAPAVGRFWVGGTGTWDSTNTANWSSWSGGYSGAATPTTTDDVYLDANSDVGTITATSSVVSLAQNLTCTGFTGTLTGTAQVTASTALSAGGTYTGLSVVETGSGSATFTSAGKQIANLTAQAGTFTLADALSVSGTLTLTSGTFTANNFAVTCGSFTSANSNTRALTLGSSSITITGSAGWSSNPSTGMTFTANTSVITLSGASAGVACGAVNWNGASFVFTGSGLMAFGPGTTSTGVANVTRTGTATKTDGFAVTNTFTISGTYTFTGNSTVNRMLVSSGVVGTSRTLTAAAVVATNADFMDITAAGAANWDLSANTGGSGDAGGNSGITFTTTAAQTWQGTAGGNWSDVTKWTSRVPLPQDNVSMAAAFVAGQTVTADMPRLGADINWTGATGSPTWAFGLVIAVYGSVNLTGVLTLTGTFGLNLYGRGSHTFTSAGKTFLSNVTLVSGLAATYTLADAFSTFGTLQCSSSTLTTNGFAIAIQAVQFFGGTLNAGTSTITCSSTGTPWAYSSGTVNTASATIVLVASSTSTRTFQGGGKTYGTLTYTVASTGALVITGANTFGTLNVGSGRTLTLPSSTTTTVTNWNVSGQDFDYLYLPGVAGNYVSTPDSVANSIAGSIDVRCKVALDDWTLSPTLLAKVDNVTTQASWQFSLVAGVPAFLWSSSGAAWTVQAVASAAPSGLVNGSPVWLRATRDGSTGDVIFYRSPDGTTWTQIGATQTGLSTAAIFDSTSSVEIGANRLGTASLLAGKFYRAQILNGINGTTVMDVDFAAKPVGANTFSGGLGNTFTVSGALAQAGDGRVDIGASTPGTAATLTKGDSVLSGSDYLRLTDITATPAATFYAGTHSVDGGGNTGWTFSDPFISSSTASLTLSASGAVRAPITATAALALLATNTALAAQASGTASVVLTGTVAAKATATGTASVVLVASGTAKTPVTGAAAMVLLTAPATARAPIVSTVAALTITATATAFAPIAPAAALVLTAVNTAVQAKLAANATLLLVASVVTGYLGRRDVQVAFGTPLNKVATGVPVLYLITTGVPSI